MLGLGSTPGLFLRERELDLKRNPCWMHLYTKITRCRGENTGEEAENASLAGGKEDIMRLKTDFNKPRYEVHLLKRLSTRD
jgi:hypothetical protein